MPPKRKQTAAAQGSLRRSARHHEGTRAPPPPDPEPPQKKKPKTKATATATAAVEQNGKALAQQLSEHKTVEGSKNIIVERCTQCRQFKMRADLVKESLEKEVAGISVVINPEKPRRGCFEIREEGGEVFVSLLDMKRPFKPMRELDMEKVISEIVEKIR